MLLKYTLHISQEAQPASRGHVSLSRCYFWGSTEASSALPVGRFLAYCLSEVHGRAVLGRALENIAFCPNLTDKTNATCHSKEDNHISTLTRCCVESISDHVAHALWLCLLGEQVSLYHFIGIESVFHLGPRPAMKA
jgi:hypothetical protein